MKKRMWSFLTCAVWFSGVAVAASQDFLERFALSDDRASVLQELVPGTPDYYYFHALYFQQQGKFDEVDSLLEAWIDRHGETEQVWEIRNRQALLRYATQPEKTLAYLKTVLGLSFDHQRQLPGEEPDLPTALDPNLISRRSLLERALNDPAYENSISAFSKFAYDWLLDVDLSPVRLRSLLESLELPDYENLPALIAKDLDAEGSGGFGSIRIHNLLVKEQLDELLELKPALLNNPQFVSAYLQRLRPSNDEPNWRTDPAVLRNYLENLDAFTTRLNAAHNSLKAHVVYQRLALDLSEGTYDQDLFMRYLRLPRQAEYINVDYLREIPRGGQIADLNQDFSPATGLLPIGLDEPLVRRYLEHFFADLESYNAFTEYIREDYLRRLFAETKLLLGQGNLEQWYSWLSPSEVDALKNRVDLEFLPSNKRQFGLEEPVSLELWVKNVDRLMVKVFEIDEQNYYQQQNRPVNTDIEIDGLVANQEETFTYGEPPLRRVQRVFDFPQLKGRGVWVIEFVGNGTSSRAVVEKGRLQYLARRSPVGQLLTVFDETGKTLPDASVWFGGRTYTANENGEIALPFSTSPDVKPVVLMHGEFASLDSIAHEPEGYSLHAGIQVDRESLRSGRVAKLALRPLLQLNGEQAPLSLLKDAALVLQSTTHDGVVSTQRIQGLELKIDEVFLQEFRVPQNLSTLVVTLTGRVDPLTASEPLELNVQKVIEVNAIDATFDTASIYLSRTRDKYMLELRDKTGLPLAGKAVQTNLWHQDFTFSTDVSLKTDRDGRIELGALEGIVALMANTAGLHQQVWDLRRLDQYTYPAEIHGKSGGTLSIPLAATPGSGLEPGVSLLETRGGVFVADDTESVKVANGYVEISQLPPGDYLLHLKSIDQRITLRVTEGEELAASVASNKRLLDTGQPTPLQVRNVVESGDTVQISIGGATEYTRVHVVATRFYPEPLFELAVPHPSPYQNKPVIGTYSLYQSGRQIGDEYRYVLERRFADRFPGNMLERPSMLLNPWAVQETEAAQEEAAPGEAAMPSMAPPPPATEAAGEPPSAQRTGPIEPLEPNYDFLGGDSAALYNLKPDENGVVSVPRTALGGRHFLQIVATDPFTTVSKSAALNEGDVPTLDRRLAKALDPAGHFVEQKKITSLEESATLSVSRTGEANAQAYDSVGSVYALFSALNSDGKLREFSFIAGWPQLPVEQKQSLYSKYASHELNFFLFHKDPEFFKSTVKPFIENKYAKQFMDEWLLERDLQSYLEPWRYGQLNFVEKILLAKRIANEQPNTLRFVEDAVDMIPSDPERLNALFMTALYGGSLSAQVSGRASGQADDEFANRPAMFGAAPAGFDINGDGVEELARFYDSASAGVRLENGAAKPELEALSTPVDAPMRADLKMVERRTRRQLGEDFVREIAAYRALYQAVEKTREWVENQYYKLPLDQQTSGLIPVNPFWRDYAAATPGTPFRSTHLAEAAGNFTEMMQALAVLDLPFAGGAHKSEMTEEAFTLTAASPLIAYYKDIQPAEVSETSTPILVSQNFYRMDDRYRYEGNEQFDKFVKDEFLTNVVYGCQITVTNPTSTPHQIELLRQTPQGALPVASGRYTVSERLRLEPYSTATLEYYFYFPKPGQFQHYPVHVSEEGALLAFAEPLAMNAVDAPSSIDTTSWQFVSQQGGVDDVIAYLEGHNLNRLDLSAIAWRMRDRQFFDRVLSLLEQRHVFDSTLWAYAVHHDVAAGISTLLRHRDDFVNRTGPWIESQLLTIDPVERKSYQHIEYKPLINPRAHQLENKWTITNAQLEAQYLQLLHILTHRTALDQDDWMAVTYYMLLQDRVGEALGHFARVQPDTLETSLQYDYFKAYLAFSQENPAAAEQIAAEYTEYPVERWRNLFADLRAQAQEIAGQFAADSQAPLKQDRLAATEPSLELELKENEIVLYHSNIEKCLLSFYPIDLEMLFTRSPFEPEKSSVFAGIKPAYSQTVTLAAGQNETTVALPDQFADAHVVIEVEASGMRRSEIRYASRLVVQSIQNYGQIHVTDKETGKPLPKVYTKVFARLQDGQTIFYRDGYTDLRGRFDYASSSTLDVANVAEFAIMVLSEDRGARVLTASPPVR